MTREEELDWLCRLRSEIYVYMPEEWLIPMNNALDMAISALSAEPCDDCIGRQAVEDITWEEPSYSDPLNVLTEVREKVRALPSVENKGEWIYDGDCYICNQCKSAFNWWADSQTSNYCPNCGADMRGE